MDQPNVLLVIWDACQLDVARSAAPNLADLAEENLWFENAIAPAGQSLGSHVAMLTGEYPHEHGIYRQTDMVTSPLSLLEELGERGYDRYCVSSNGFAAPRYGFDRGFDRFYNTQGVTAYPDGLDLHAYARRVREERGEVSIDIKDVDHAEVLYEAVTHTHPLKSLANVAAAGVSELTSRYSALQRVPHPRFDQYNEFCYDPEQNTRIVTSILENSSESSDPFFLLTNYMDAHHPYAPPKRYQREYCGRTFSYRELSELSELTHPWNYLERIESEGQLDESTLADVRGLYRGEVRTADEHLGRLLDHLERTGLREETVVVVVADHGENLGEENWMGEHHMGHVRSASEHHLRVPMVVSHPSIDGRKVEEYVSTKDLHGLFTDGLKPFLSSAGRDMDSLVLEDGIVSCEVPRTTTTALAEKYPELAGILERHLSATYAKGWKVVVSSDGSEYAWTDDGESRSIQAAPDSVVETCRANVESLVAGDDEQRELSGTERTHLEALGYM